MKSVNVFRKTFVMAIIISAIVFVFFWANMEFVRSADAPGLALKVKNKLCYVNFKDERSHVNKTTDLKMIYFVTPTYPRPEQVPELTRLAHTLMHVPRLHWIIADDQPGCSDIVYQFSLSSADAPGLALKVKNKLCYVNFKDERSHVNKTTDLKMIYFVTPTYPRPEQVPELTRLAHTLMHVPRLHWIIADDQPGCSDIVYDLLRRSGLPYTHISSPKPYSYKESNFPRGVSNRRASLAWLRENVHEGVLYFGDDDNTVDLQLFDEIRNTKKVSMFPVGLIGSYGVSTPIVKDGKVVAFFDSWPGSRTFPVDMAGFAVNIEFLTPSASMPYIAGHEEDRFLVSLGLKLDEIEPLAANCSKVLVWHTKTAKYKKPSLKIDLEKFDNSPKYRNFVSLLKETSRLGMAYLSSNNGTKTYVIRNRKQYETSGGLL